MKDKTTNPASEKESSPALKGEKSQSAFTLIGVVILIVIIGLMIGTGLEVLGPKVKRSKILNTKKIIDAAIESITGYVATNNRLPDTSTFPAVVSNPNDVWGKPLYYITDEDLTDSTYGGICGRKTTQLQLLSCPSTGCGTPTNTIENVALIILSGSANFNNQTAGSAVVDTETDINHYSQGLELDDYTTDMDRTEPYDDVVKWLTLDELRIKAGCEVSQLKIVNNELPYGYENSAYTATIFGDGGVPYASGGTYKWCRQESASTGLTFILSTLTSDCLNLTESSWTKADSIVISGTPATAGTYTITFFVRDDNDPSGINDNISQRTLVLTINEPSSSAGTSLWIGHDEGNLQSCDTSGSCTNHGDKGDDIKVMAVFNSKLWIGNKDEHLYSCDSTGSCTDHGDKGEEIKAMAVFDNKLWIGQKEGDLRSCDSSGSCTNHGNKGEEIKAMAVFDNKLWIGQKEGDLQSCNSSGSCTNHGDKGDDIKVMAVFNSKLWIGNKDEHLYSCDSTGSCTDHGDKGEEIKAMAVFDNKLWIGQKEGGVRSCDSSGTCTNHGDKGDDIESMFVFDSKLWIGHKEGRLQSCNSSGSCTNHGDKGDDINAMAGY